MAGVNDHDLLRAPPRLDSQHSFAGGRRSTSGWADWLMLIDAAGVSSARTGFDIAVCSPSSTDLVRSSREAGAHCVASVATADTVHNARTRYDCVRRRKSWIQVEAARRVLAMG